MADKDFKVKNKLFVNGLSQASGVVLSTNNNLDSHTNLPTQYGGTGTTTSPNAGQILYSTAGSTYTPTDLSSLTISNSGGSTITAASAETKGLVIKRASSQTANLIEWQNTDNSVLSSVGPLGAVSINTQNANALGVSALGALEVKRTAFFDAGTSATVAVVVRGRPSQTANLQEWQNSAGTVLTSISSGGNIVVGNTGTLISYASGRGIFALGDPASVGLTVKAAASQTANLQEWQNSNGGVDTAVTSTGRLSVRTTLADAGLNVGAPSAATVNLIVRGAASQTANLQEWQNSAGTVLANIFADGDIGINSIRSVNGSVKRILMNQTTESVRVIAATASYIGLVVKGVASQTADLQQWQDSAGAVLTKITSGGTLRVPIITDAAATGSLIYMNTTNINIDTRTATNIGLIINGVASQTASLQEWRNSAGTVLASIDPNGQLRTPQILNTASFNNSRLQMTNTGSLFDVGVASNVALRVRGAASQTANLQEWQDSSGTVLARTTASGGIASSVFVTAGTVNAGTNLGVFTAYPVNASTVGIVIKGFASQTANLQEWQDSTGTVLSSVTANGRIFAQLTSELYGTIQSKPYTSGAHAIYAQGLGSTPAVRIDTISATANGLVIKGAASQTANLQEWQNSAGTTLSYMSPAGVFSAGTLIAGSGDLQVAYGGYFGGGTAGSYIGAALSVIPWSTTVAGVIVRGRASQTADLQQWQDSAGTVLAEITANGGLELNGKDVELMNYMGAF